MTTGHNSRMEHSINLLNKALQVKKAAQWARDLNLDPSTIAQAKKRGKMSPPMAGVFALEMGESVEHWMAVAALDDVPESPTKSKLLRVLRKVYLSTISATRRVVGQRIRRTEHR